MPKEKVTVHVSSDVADAFKMHGLPNTIVHKPTVISICAKCSDMFSATIKDETGKDMFDYNGYVPGFFPDEHYGDYVMLDIELATGKILNWKKPTKSDLKKLQEGDRD